MRGTSDAVQLSTEAPCLTPHVAHRVGTDRFGTDSTASNTAVNPTFTTMGNAFRAGDNLLGRFKVERASWRQSRVV